MMTQPVGRFKVITLHSWFFFIADVIRTYHLACNLVTGQFSVLIGQLIRVIGYASKNSSVLEAKSIRTV